MDSKLEAQRRVDQIGSFNQELQQLEKEGVFTLDESQKLHITNHHTQLISSLKTTFDIDHSLAGKQFSLGMKVVSFVGSVSFAASIFFMFYMYWGYLTSLQQTVVLVLTPLLCLLLTGFLKLKEQSGYLAKITGCLSVVAFVLNLSMLGHIYNISPSANAFAVWCLLALGLAYLTHSRVLLVSAIAFFTCFVTAQIPIALGDYWLSYADDVENFILPAILLFIAGHKVQLGYENFAAILRISAVCILFLVFMMLSFFGEGSYLNWDADVIESSYQTIGLLLACMVTWYGVNKGWSDLVSIGGIFFTVFLFCKFFDWWWELFPKYLFFMVIALTAILMLLIFKRLRMRLGHSSNKQGVAYD